MGHPLTLSQLRMDQSALTSTPPPSIKGTRTETVQVSFLPFFPPPTREAKLPKPIVKLASVREEEAEDGVSYRVTANR